MEDILETEQVTVKEKETSLDEMRQKFEDAGARRMEVIEKTRGGILVCTLELWRTINDREVDNEAVIWIMPDGSYKIYGLIDKDEY